MLNAALAFLVLLALLGAGATLRGRRRWARRTRELRDDLDAAQLPPAATCVDFRALEGLPAPVQRYFRAVLQDGAPVVVAVDIGHAGTFNLGTRRERWRPFTSSQRVTIRRPGFVWDGRVSLLPGLALLVHDACVAGEGLLHATLAGCLTLSRLQGTPAVAQGELMRYLAEAAWYPTALLPGQGVHWDAIDARSARATLSEGSTTAALVFRFGDDDLVESVRSEARGRMVGTRVLPTPWEGRWSNYQWQDGMQVPRDGEVAWLLQHGRQPYWRGRITRLAYEFSG